MTVANPRRWGRRWSRDRNLKFHEYKHKRPTQPCDREPRVLTDAVPWWPNLDDVDVPPVVTYA